MAGAAATAARERCLREACLLTRARVEADRQERRRLRLGQGRGGGATGGEILRGASAGSVEAGGGTNANMGMGFLAGPLATPPIDIPRKADVEKAMLRRQHGDHNGSGGSSVRAVPPFPSSSSPISPEKCGLCGAQVVEVSPEGRVGGGGGGGVGGGATSRGSGGGEGGATPRGAAGLGTSLELPGWTVCRMGHRLRRCMNSLLPSLAVEYRRCEVCRSVMEMPLSSNDGCGGGGGGGGVGEGGGCELPQERCVCVFCNVLLASGSFAVCWLG